MLEKLIMAKFQEPGFTHMVTFGVREKDPEVVFVNPKKEMIRTIVDKNGRICNFPGVRSPELIEEYTGQNSVIPKIAYRTAIEKRDHGSYVMFWQIQPDGRFWEDEDGFGGTSDMEVELYTFLNEEGEFTAPFRVHSAGVSYFLETDNSRVDQEKIRKMQQTLQKWKEEGNEFIGLKEELQQMLLAGIFERDLLFQEEQLKGCCFWSGLKSRMEYLAHFAALVKSSCRSDHSLYQKRGWNYLMSGKEPLVKQVFEYCGRTGEYGLGAAYRIHADSYLSRKDSEWFYTDEEIRYEKACAQFLAERIMEESSGIVNARAEELHHIRTLLEVVEERCWGIVFSLDKQAVKELITVSGKAFTAESTGGYMLVLPKYGTCRAMLGQRCGSLHVLLEEW